MQSSPNFTKFYYKVLSKLGSNVTGGRVTYKALELKTNTLVVIKQFRFATATSAWSEYKALEKEIKTLQQINHPQIPKYITDFDPGDGLCLVMQYIEGQPLSCRSFAIEEVRAIAVSLLEILIYLQSLNPPIIHRDIKPENILVDDEKNIHLVDFGLASTMINESMGVSSVVAGTIGFMPPEQLLRKQVDTSSDVYSLGVTLFCLLMGKSTRWLTSIIDSSFQIRISKYLNGKINYDFLKWLEQCIEVKIENRFKDARTALARLKQISIYIPQAKSTNQIEISKVEIANYLKKSSTKIELKKHYASQIRKNRRANSKIKSKSNKFSVLQLLVRVASISIVSYLILVNTFFLLPPLFEQVLILIKMITIKPALSVFLMSIFSVYLFIFFTKRSLW